MADPATVTKGQRAAIAQGLRLAANAVETGVCTGFFLRWAGADEVVFHLEPRDREFNCTVREVERGDD